MHRSAARRPLAAAACALALAAVACVDRRDGSPDTAIAADRADASGTSGSPSPRAAANAAALRDDFGDTVPPRFTARRIVSLAPTTTELLFAIGAGDRVVGRTRWDTYPDSARRVPDLGDGLRPNVEAVLAARPDLVVLYASADNRAAADALRRAGIATLSLRVDRIEHFRRAATALGALAGAPARARAVVDSVDDTLARVRAATASRERPTVFWHVWDAPLITIGRGSYLNELLEIAGGRNVFDDLAAPSPQVSFEELLRRDPAIVLAGPEGAARLRADPGWRRTRALREGRLVTVDTALVGRPGVRLGEAAVSLARVLHPGVVP